jgi:hypothetical protein
MAETEVTTTAEQRLAELFDPEVVSIQTEFARAFRLGAHRHPALATLGGWMRERLFFHLERLDSRATTTGELIEAAIEALPNSTDADRALALLKGLREFDLRTSEELWALCSVAVAMRRGDLEQAATDAALR